MLKCCSWKYLISYDKKGGILANVLILLFFVSAVGIPIVLFVGNYADNKSEIRNLDDKTKPRKLRKLESEASRKKEQADDESSTVEDTEDTTINENLKLAGLWKKHYQSIETTAKSLENSSLVIDDDKQYAEILSQYKKIQMLNTINSDENLAKYITQELRDNLEQFEKSIGDYLSEYKKSYVLKKADAFVARHAYDEALAYLKDVVEGKYPYDMPQIFIDNKNSGVAGISRKDREIEKYWFENEKILNAEKEFRTNPVYSDVLRFKSTINVNNSTRLNYEEAFRILEKLTKFNTDFTKKYSDVLEVKPVADEIITCLNDMTAIILNSIDCWLIGLNDGINNNESKKSILLDFVAKLKNKFDSVEKYDADKALKIWDSLISALQAADEPQKTISLNYDEMERMLTVLKSDIASFVDKSVIIKPDDISILESRLTKILDKTLMAGWITENYIPEKSGEISNLIEMVESKIFRMLYDSMNSQKFQNRKFRKEWAAWCIIFKLVWKPGESRFGTNINKMMKIKNIEFLDDDFANACLILESISANSASVEDGKNDVTENTAFYMTNVYKAVGHIESITFDLFKFIKNQANGSKGNLSPEKIAVMKKLAKILRFNVLHTVKLRTTVEGLILNKLLKNSIENLEHIFDFLLENSDLNKPDAYKFNSEQNLLKRFFQTLKTK